MATLVTNLLETATNCSIGMPCLICGETVILDDRDMIKMEYGRDLVKVCDNCKAAVMAMRKQLLNGAGEQ